jgi:hypothetical protein
VKLPARRAGLPGNVDMIIGSALTPLRGSVTALPAPAYRQEGGHPADLPVRGRLLNERKQPFREAGSIVQ